MDVEKIKLELFKKQKTGMLESLFGLNSNEKEVNVTIILGNDQNAMIVPYRNIKCKKLTCLYDEDDLIQQSLQNNKKMTFTFACKFCKTKIDFKDFFLDEDLYELVNRLFGCYNKTEIVVRDITLQRGGVYFPKFLKRPGMSIVRDTNIPSMRDHSDESYSQMKEAFEKKGKNQFVPTDTIISKMGLALTYEQLELLIEEQVTSVPLMAFLINYAYNYQENQYERKGNQNLKRNLCLITLIVFGLTSEKQLDSEYLTNFENYYSPQELINNFENVAVIIYYEKTWSLLLTDLKEGSSHFYIFKDHMQAEYAAMLSAVIAEQFAMKDSIINYVENFSFHSPTEAKYSGTLVFRLLMWLIDPPSNPQPFSEFNDMQIDLIRRQTTMLEWLLYQMMQQDKKTDFIFADMKVQEQQKDQGSVPSIISLQGIQSPSFSSGHHLDSSNLIESEQNRKHTKKKKKKDKFQDDNPIEEVDSDQESIDDQRQDEILDEDGFNFQIEFDKLKQKYEKKGIVRIPKQELDSLVEKLQYDVSKEIQRKRKADEIQQETLADYYIDQKMQEFNIKIMKQKESKKKKKKKKKGKKGSQYDEQDQDEGDIQDQYINGKVGKEELLERQQVQLSMMQMKEILKQFEVDMHKRIDFKQKNNVQDSVDRDREMADYMEWYNTFVQLLHYYYNYDIETYKQLIDEYNYRFHNMIFHKLGLDFQSTQNANPNLNNNPKSNPSNPNSNRSNLSNPNANSNNKDQIINQPYNQVSSSNMFLNQNGQNNKYSMDNRSQMSGSGKQYNGGHSLLQAAGQQVIRSNNNKNNKESDAFTMGQQYNEQILQKEMNKIVASRYQKVITEGDLVKLRSGNFLTEDGLNFFIKYLEERQGQQQYIYKLNQKEYPKGMRILYLSGNFYKYYSKGNAEQVDELDFKSVRHYMKQYSGENNSIFDRFDKICIPIIVSMNEMHVVVVNLQSKQLLLFITSYYQAYPKDAVNNPILQNIMRFLQKELYEKKLKNLNYIDWQLKYVYLDEMFTKNYKYSILNTAFIINLLSKQKTYQSQPYSQLISFNQNLVRLFTQIGITQNKRNELIIENLPL